MRRAEEVKVWGSLKKKRRADPPAIAKFDEITLDLSTPCLVVGGRNGAGKTRLLRSIADHLGDDGLLLDLHFLCEQALTVLRSRDDFDEMTAEFDVLGPDEDRQDDVQRVIGREYELIDWYALEVEPSDKAVAERFRWGGEQSLLPYFEVQHKGVHYSSREMGLGEFSVHLLFWILEQYRDVEGLTLLLDEPDAYLPPIGASALLVRLLRICLDREWRLIVTTHSSEMIADALEEQAFVLLRTGDEGTAIATHCQDDPTVADTLLARPPIRHVFFVEDESAWMLAHVLIEAYDRRLARASAVVWGNGSGYMVELQEHFPRPPQREIVYTYLFDGDKRAEVHESKQNRWPALFLPTDSDPDVLFRTLRADVPRLAAKLNVPDGELSRFLDTKEGVDAHDWVNDLGAEYGRPRVLRTLAELWVDRNESTVTSFFEALREAL